MSFPPEYQSFKPLAEAAFNYWAPGSSPTYKALKNGASGATVMKVDIRGKHGGKLENGQYVLKLGGPKKWIDQTDESEAHARAHNWNPDFSTRHVPSLIASFSGPEDLGYALLYEIAGGSLDSYMAVDQRESSAFLAISKTLIRDTLSSWTRNEPTEDKRPHELLEDWLGYRLDPVEGQALHSFVKDQIGEDLTFTQSGEGLINPLKFYSYSTEKQWAERGYLKALLHGDLHGGNILVNKFIPDDQSYWIIDFALSKEGPAGYDQAYLELAQIIYCLGEQDPALLIGVLKNLEPTTRGLLLPDGTLWLHNCLQLMRQATTAWRNEVQPKRIDDFNRQLCLARIAAGLNWANKPLSDNQRYLSLCYAGWAAREYLRDFENDAWIAIGPNQLEPKTDSEIQISSADQALWEELWNITRGFSPRNAKYILVAEAQEDLPYLRSLGQLPWSAVIDLDPYSDVHGLYRHAAAPLQARRSLHTFSLTIPITEFDRGTAWMMAAGWTIRNEPPPNYTSWLYDRLQVIRTFVKALDDAVDPTPIHVIVIPGKTLDPAMPMARLGKVIGAIDEVTRGKARILLLGRTALSEPIRVDHIPLDTKSLLACIYQTFGLESSSNDAQIPATNKETEAIEWRTIPIDVLRTIQENLDVLHSNVLGESSSEGTNAEPNSFWRGRPPTWADFHAENDIPRDINNKLTEVLREALDASRNRTILLYHNPGAGGTTAAFRAAWQLHWEYPTAVLRHWSAALSDRLQQLFSMAQRPVLLVADGTDLSEAAREDLYRELSERNSRVVILYLRRVFGDSDLPIALFDPMTAGEAKRFNIAFAAQTKDPKRRQELARITEDEELMRYRSPFFYGLVTFERDFLAVDKYVGSHLSGLRGQARDVVEYIALLTIYSNTGLHEIILRRLMGLSGESNLVLSELVGEGPARLMTTRQGRIRLMHQVIAEEVLSDLSTGGSPYWRRELDHLSTGLIRDVTACASPSSQVVLNMFRQLFTERIGGAIDGVDDKEDFAPIIEVIDGDNRSKGHQVLKKLTEKCPLEAHFWNHLGRHQIYRMQRNPEQAEQYLQEAIRLSPGDYIHYHTLGLVRRFRLREVLRGLRDQTAAEALSSLSGYFERVVEAFDKTRAINPENIYGYITHVQTILEVADYLKRASGVQNIAQLENQPTIVVWVEDQVTLAEKLLADAQQLYGTLDQERHSYITNCYANLQKLYGDLDRVIEIWELASIHGTDNAISRRALANAYFARNGRRWDTMEVSELRRIFELTERNLNTSARRDDDYRLWFEAYKLLPEFEIEEAISKLHSWASNFPSWRAYYYLYILQFLLWFGGKIDATTEMQDALEKCQKFIIGRSHISHQWLGYGPTDCPIVSADSLGEWPKALGFWKEPSSLRPINGVIDEIRGPQAGNILIDGKVRAFFVPSKGEFYRNKDENNPVHFYLGFSPVGLRAWDVKSGHVEKGNRSRYGLPQPVQVPELVYRPAISDEVKLSRVKALKLSRVLAFIDDVVKARTAVGAELALAELEERLEAVFRVAGIAHELGFRSLEEMLRKETQHTFIQRGADLLLTDETREDRPEPSPPVRRQPVLSQIVMLNANKSFGYIEDLSVNNRWFHRSYVLRGHQNKLKGKGQIVEYLPDVSDRGPIAVDIRIYDDSFTLSEDGLIPKTELREKAKATTLRILRDALADGDSSVSLADLYSSLTNEFKGYTPLVGRLSVRKLDEFLREINEISVQGKYPNQYVRLRDQRAFGRLAPERPNGDKLFAELRDFVLNLLRQDSKTAQLRVDVIQQQLNRKFGRDKDLHRLGYSSLLAFLGNTPEVEVGGPNPADQYVRLVGIQHEQKPADKPQQLPASTLNKAGEAAPLRPAKTPPPLKQPRPATEDLFAAEPLKSARNHVLDILQAKADDKDLKVVSLAYKLAGLIPGTGSLIKRLNRRGSFLDLLKEMPECEIYGSRTDPLIRLKPEYKTNLSVPSMEDGAAGAEVVSRMKTLVVKLAREAQSAQQDLTFTRVTAILDAEVPGAGPLAKRLGYESFRSFLADVPEVQLYEQQGKQFLRLTPKTRPEQVVLEIVREKLKGGNGLTVLTLASLMARRMPGEGKLADRLGYTTFTEFLTSVAAVEIYSTNGTQYVRLREEPQI